MSDRWNVPKRSNNCNISMLTEKINAIFPLCHRIFFHLFPIISSNDHITTAENGIIMITFSIHSIPKSFQPTQIADRLVHLSAGCHPTFMVEISFCAAFLPHRKISRSFFG